MSQIPPLVASIAQTQQAQRQQAARNDNERDAQARRAAELRRRADESREFVETMAEANGLKVDEDGHPQHESRKKRRFLDLLEGDTAPRPDDAAPPIPPADPRAQAAALLADPGAEGQAPPPCMIDVEA
ncbi:MAG: hypothetical protein GX591_07490 [Planctomycetes bacterium]|nr:hypothetical protein [Planctomycetota bacterium]